MIDIRRGHLYALLCLTVLTVGCSDSGSRGDLLQSASAESCMTCHNGSQADDYGGPGIENPHPFGTASNLGCTTCHGGNPLGTDQATSHVPPPPQIGDRQQWITDRRAYFNRLTLTGIDKYPDYTVNGTTYTAIDYLQFVNPSDLRVVTQGRSCGVCHSPHVDTVANSLLATEAGILSGAMYAAGSENAVPSNQGLFEDTAADMGFRPVFDPTYVPDPMNEGTVGSLIEFPVFSVRGANGPLDIHNNPAYDSQNLPASLNADNSVITNSPLANLFHEQVAFTCGDCHLGSAGANNRYGDFRTSGCAACHMRKSLSGRSLSGDPNINRLEPYDVDDIDEPELSHLGRHVIRSVAQTLPSGEFLQGIDDYSCAGCHQGSNRTVMQYWGIRLDQNQDVRRRVQYPANPVSYRTTSGDTRLFDPNVIIYDQNGVEIRRGNQDFNGRNRNQYLLEEDYDGDGRDDTPPDVHYEAGMGCIDCHGSYDLHGGDVLALETEIHSRMEQAVAIKCESCHGSVDAYAVTTPGLDYNDQTADLVTDAKGNAMRHVYRDAAGAVYLRSRLTGNIHFVPQTRDTVVDNGLLNPMSGQPIYNAKASYAMGRNDGNAQTGIGPQQTNRPQNGFSHADNMSCVACHASWTNSCVGCHLEGEYDTGANFSNITGERIVFEEQFAEFVYQSPVLFQLGVDTDNKVAPIAANTDTFFRWEDRNNVRSQVFAFSDRNGAGNNPGTSQYPALSHNVIMPHSIRGRVTSSNEGPRYCVACHLTTEGLNNYGTEYTQLATALQNPNFNGLDLQMFQTLQTHIGRNPGNQMNSPLWIQMVVGLGTGLFLFDQDGCAVNPLDQDNQRFGCEGVAPANNFDLSRVAYNLDRIVEPSGVSNSSNNHAMDLPRQGPLLRAGATDANLAGPLGAFLIQRLADPINGIVLDSWLDANSMTQGSAPTFVPLVSNDGSGDAPQDDEAPSDQSISSTKARKPKKLQTSDLPVENEKQAPSGGN